MSELLDSQVAPVSPDLNPVDSSVASLDVPVYRINYPIFTEFVSGTDQALPALVSDERIVGVFAAIPAGATKHEGEGPNGTDGYTIDDAAAIDGLAIYTMKDDRLRVRYLDGSSAPHDAAREALGRCTTRLSALLDMRPMVVITNRSYGGQSQ